LWCGSYHLTAAEDDEKDLQVQFTQATLESAQSAMAGKPSVDDMLARSTAAQPFKVSKLLGF